MPALRPRAAHALPALPGRAPPADPPLQLHRRTFGETRRRVKVIGRLPDEASCLSLLWAVFDRASRGWPGFTMTATGLRLLQDLQHQLLDPPTPLHRHPAQTDHDTTETAGAVA